MFEGLKKYLSRFGIPAAILVVLISLVAIRYSGNIKNHDHTAELQRNFTQREHELVRFTKKVTEALRSGQTDKLDMLFPSTSPFFLHVFRNDSLIYWNTNKMPVYSIAELHFPSEGLFNLQNGWYFSDMVKVGHYKIVGSFLLQRIYPYENEQLHNEINPLLTHAKGIILPDKIPQKNIYCRHEKPLFSFQETPDPEVENVTATSLFIGFILLILLVWVQLNKWFRQKFAPLAFALGFIVLRILAIQFNWTEPFKTSSLFDPSILAMSELTPNLGELLLSFVVLLIIINSLIRFLQRSTKPTFFSRAATFTGLLLLTSGGLWMSYAGQQMVENSSIPLQLDQIFELDRYSLIVLAIIGIAGYSYILLAGQLMKSFLNDGWSKTHLLIIFAAGIAISLSSFVFTDVVTWSAAFWTILITAIVVLVTLFNAGKWNFTLILFALFLFSISTSINIKQYAGIKEMEERELYANQLADEKDINTEIEFIAAREKLLRDPYLQRFKTRSNRPEASEIKEALERRVFNGYWERYDIDFFYFDLDSNERFNGKRLSDFETLMTRHGEKTEIDTSLYFIKDYTSQYTYIFRIDLSADSLGLALFGTLKSKKIPEEIGFPRLLISDKAKVFESLGNYSIAKYYNNKLVFKYGDYSYPIESGAFPEVRNKEKTFFNRDGYNHYFLRKTSKDFIILSKQNIGWLDGVTAVAFLFVTYGAFLALFMLFESRVSFVGFNGLSLAVKIQVVLVGLVFTALLAFGIGSGTFVRSQYEEYTSDLIREKLHSIGVVSRIRFGEHDSINEPLPNFDLAYHLQNWSNIFVTDVNIYDLNGQLAGSSRPKIYNIGLLSEQMNPDAIKALVKYKKSEYIHQERIGKLVYLSAYIPFFNNEGTLIAYINLQHFDQQNEFESQIQRFLVAIINVFMLLLALSIISAVFISSWLTSPLRMIRSSFSRMELGKSNQPIVYTSKDEIGDLVREYNKKLAELDLAAFNLAQSERESAWREMAKQVAHEIKNPLTPMKLSIQQLLRVYDAKDPDSGEKLERVAKSVIEQIDALTTIANAFSNFAKMPQPKMEVIDLKLLIENAVALFSHDGFGNITLKVSDNLYTEGDREMLLRVMNNMITNAIQAIPPSVKGNIIIETESDKDTIVISVSDNGTGIPDDKVQTIFEPYFTTKSTGTGLGLAMVRQIIEGHKGSIRVKSTSSEGTVMEITLPLYKN